MFTTKTKRMLTKRWGGSMKYLKPYREALKREFPDVSDDKIAVLAFIAHALRGRDRINMRPIGYDKHRQMELDSLNEEMAVTYGNRRVS